ncbi:MAG: diacylglycerol kinase family protein [Reyranella sp.]|nr:diacylglycerol kinase family protein [Reyranella sp.]MDP3159946.1 diacylglycerol kinase family protein [Reyranella sp.]
MVEQASLAVVVNRAANKGGAGRRWPAIEAQLKAHLGFFQPLFTEAPGHATGLARDALSRGARRFVAVGGDGTANEVLNGLLDASGRLIAPDAVLCPVPAGTANELCRALGHLEDPTRAYAAAAGRGSRSVDLLRVRCVDLAGHQVERFGYLIVSLGAAATISHRTSRSAWLKKLGEIAYLLMTPVVTLGYRHREVAIAIDGGMPQTRRLFTAMVANTENGGGGMKLMPGAKFDDGILDLIEMGDISRLGVLLGVMPKLYSGAHVGHPKVRVSQGTSFRFESGVETLVDLDGETIGRLPLEVSVLPRAFLVGAP